MDISQKLRAVREKRGFTRRQLGDWFKPKVSERTIESWEQGRRKPRGIALLHLERILNKELKRHDEETKSSSLGTSDSGPGE